jgi:hypothetical protein
VNDPQVPKSDIPQNMADTVDTGSSPGQKTRREAVKLSALTVATALAAMGAVFVHPAKALARGGGSGTGGSSSPSFSTSGSSDSWLASSTDSTCSNSSGSSSYSSSSSTPC